jgi:hypothetical protein
MLRTEYERFCEAWKNEKAYQKILIDDGTAHITETETPEGQTLRELRTGKGAMPMLGRKPTFSQWLAARKNKQTTQQPAQEDKPQSKVEVTDTEW